MTCKLKSSKGFEYNYSCELTQEHIDCGWPESPLQCAVALFLIDIENRPVRVLKRGAYEDTDTWPHRGKKLASFEKDLRAFIRQFDKDKSKCTPQKIGVHVGPRGGVKMEIVD